VRRSIRLAAAAAALCLVFPASVVTATTPASVEFFVPTVIPADGGPTYGPFTASGPAVDAGIMCPTGQTADVFGKAAGFQSPAGINLLVVKQFTCDDRSGTFLVKLQVRIDARSDNFTWLVIAGDGAYARLRGAGSGFGTFPYPDEVDDNYAGGLHIG
jgi:hypothetical protein